MRARRGNSGPDPAREKGGAAAEGAEGAEEEEEEGGGGEEEEEAHFPCTSASPIAELRWSPLTPLAEHFLSRGSQGDLMPLDCDTCLDECSTCTHLCKNDLHVQTRVNDM